MPGREPFRDGNVFDVTRFGARPDDVGDSTVALQAAIDACATQGGGIVRVPGPGVYLTYTLSLKSGVELRIDRGATLKGGPDPFKYPEFGPSPHWRPEHAPRFNKRAMFYTVGQRQVSITGDGTIDGNAEAFHSWNPERQRIWRNSDTEITGRCVFFVACQDVTLRGITIHNPSGWATWFLDCDNVDIRKITIDCHPQYPNGDGIHLSGCRDVIVTDCVVDSQDDSIILRSSQEQMLVPRALERVAITNCSVSNHSAAIRIGWTGDYAIRDITVDNIVCRHAWSAFQIILPPLNHDRCNDPPRAPDLPLLPPENRLPFAVENLRFTNLDTTSDDAPLQLVFGDAHRTEPVDYVRNLVFDNCRFAAGKPPVFVVWPENHFENLRFSDVEFIIRKRTPSKIVPADCLWFDNCKGIVFDRCSWSSLPAD